MNLYELLQQRMHAGAAHEFLAVPGERACSYGEFDQLCGRYATALRQLGVQAGERVVAQVDKSVAAVALYLATLRVGAVFVPLNTAYTSAELAFFLADAEPRLFACRPQMLAELAPVAAAAGVEHCLALPGVPDRGAADDLQALALAAEPTSDVAARDGDDLACIVYTSGTTGRSKGAMITHANLSSNALALHRIWGFRDGDVLLHALPIFHVHGLFVALHCAILNVSRVMFLPRFDLEQVIAAQREATVMMGVPTFYSRLVEAPGYGPEQCAGMRLFISGSAPLTEATFHAFTARTGHTILERYGMTEAGMIASNPLQGERIAGTVGFALPDVEIRVTDADGSVLEAGAIGEVEVRGPNVFAGYWQLPDKTREEFRPDGFFITGDLGSLDQEGRLRIVGRGKDLIICGGYNVYPKEVELALDQLPQVRESAVIGVPHPDLGEAVVAVLVCDAATPDIEAIDQHLSNRLARFKQPRAVRSVAELPRNAMGKVQKNELRERFEDLFS